MIIYFNFQFIVRYITNVIINNLLLFIVLCFVISFLRDFIESTFKILLPKLKSIVTQTLFVFAIPYIITYFYKINFFINFLNIHRTLLMI